MAFLRRSTAAPTGTVQHLVRDLSGHPVGAPRFRCHQMAIWRAADFRLHLLTDSYHSYLRAAVPSASGRSFCHHLSLRANADSKARASSCHSIGLQHTICGKACKVAGLLRTWTGRRPSRVGKWDATNNVVLRPRFAGVIHAAYERFLEEAGEFESSLRIALCEV